MHAHRARVRLRTSRPARGPTRRVALVLALAVTLTVLGCSRAPAVRFHAQDAYPERLSEWGVLVRDGDSYVLGGQMVPYEINSSLFSDHALKLRAIYLPSGTAARYVDHGPLDLPVGAIIAKTFFYPVTNGVAVAAESWSGNPGELRASTHRVVETRLLVRQPAGWDALPYVWSGEDAYLRIAGALEPMRIAAGGSETDLPYFVPSRNECASCHATDHESGALQPIGAQARHMNRNYPGSETNQLTALAAAGRLTGLPPLDGVSRTPDWRDESLEADVRARAYLDINCGHCHSATGAADTSGLMLDAATGDPRHLGICKRPVAAGRGTGGHAYAIAPGEPDASILVFRMTTTDPATRMPEIGRSLVHDAAVDVVREWIERLPGACTAA
jgi:uncharacterized repeat protein (TIGR03806 family)